jgi:hypothetical protein
MGLPSGNHKEPARPVRVESVKPDKPLTVCFVGPILGLMTHRHGGQPFPCLGESRCPTSIHRTRTLWKGYAPGEMWEKHTELWIPCVIECTENMDDQLQGRKVRGEIWSFWREGGKKEGAVLGAYSQTLPEEDQREWFSIVPILERLYHHCGLILGVENPVPRKTLLEARGGVQPRLVRELTTPLPVEVPATPEQMADLREQMRKAFGGAKKPPSKPTTPEPSAKGHTNGKGGGR